jgi:predicted glycogen debranching enzyme
MILFDSKICTDFEAAVSREWLETNGIGGFAFASIAGTNTRRYHGLLTAATRPPLGRVKMLSKYEETLIVDGQKFELSANRYPGAVHPRGFEYLMNFRLDPLPIWTYEASGVKVEKKLFMPHGENSVVLRFGVKSKLGRRGPQISLELRPLLSFVDYHHLQRQNDEFGTGYETSDGIASVKPYPDLPTLFFHHNASAVEATGHWYRNIECSIEQERGFDFYEDLFQPFVLKFDLKRDATVVASTLESAIDAGRVEKAEIRRRKALVKQSKVKDDFAQQLVPAADQFIVRRGAGHTVIAGYPWFSDWGRDTMISLPGLTLATNRSEIARDIILEFSNHISQGMLPNRFPDIGEEPEYNTVDATLWYFESIRAYVDLTGDQKLVLDELYDKLADVIDWHLKGTRYKIHVDTDGLLCAGEPGVQLTWMDAKVGDHVITPRTGKPVEIQALWYNALRIMAEFAAALGKAEDKARFDAMADLAKLSFNAAFWNADGEYLYDVVENGNRDASVRPNQIFAVALKHSMLDEERSRTVVEKVEAELLTPVGLRSLSPHDPAYVPVYIGSPWERDSAYHQGTVWGWLIGPFVEAYRKVYPGEDTEKFLAGFRAHLLEAGIGQISEIFDADPPHTPRGCPAQAWSVAEVLRVNVIPT